MTEKEKAKELIEKFVNQPINFPYIDMEEGQCIGAGYMTYESAQKCAIIAVDEILKEMKKIETMCDIGWINTYQYWQEVKNELNNL
jgi:hypothetical protein